MAHVRNGFDLHANVAVPGRDRTRLEQLCRYLLRPAVSQDRLRLLGDGRILLTLKTAWADGTRHLRFERLELLEKLAALTPRPRINLVLYHGRLRLIATVEDPREIREVLSALPLSGEPVPPRGTRSRWLGSFCLTTAAVHEPPTTEPPTTLDAAPSEASLSAASGHPSGTQKGWQVPPPARKTFWSAYAPTPMDCSPHGKRALW